jgi:hypothetical protein
MEKVATPLPELLGFAESEALAEELVVGVLEAMEEPPTEMLMEAGRPSKATRLLRVLPFESLSR